MEAASTILKVAQQIAKAAETAHQNKERCRDLAERAHIIGDSLPEATAKGDGAAASSGGALGRLNAALDDALKLVESCRRRRRQTGIGCLVSLLTSDRTAARFDDVEKKITASVGDLGLEQILQLNSAAAHDPRPCCPPLYFSYWKEKVSNRGGKNNNGGHKQNKNGTNDRSDKGKNNNNKNVTASATAKPSSEAGPQEQPFSVQDQGAEEPKVAPAQQRPKRPPKPNPKYFDPQFWTT